MVDIPYFPILPQPSKRKIIVAIAGIMGFVLVAFFILVLEFLDRNIKTAPRAKELIGLKVGAIYPRINSKNKQIDYTFLQEKAIDTIARNVIFTSNALNEGEKTSLNFFISTQKEEGKSYVISQLANKMVMLGYKVLFVNYSDSEENIEGDFEKIQYKLTNQFYRINSLDELLPDGGTIRQEVYDFIFVEIPNIINHAFPVKLLQKADHIYLVCRANRPWSEADQNNLATFREITNNLEPIVLLNGVEVIEMETFLGDLPRKRSFLRKIIKNMIRLRFFSKNKIAS